MKVILLKDVKKVGKANEVVEVSDGYARNFLFRQKLAVQVSDKSMDVLNQQKEEVKQQQEEVIQESKKLKEKIESLTLHFTLKVGSNNRVFGSVSTKQIADVLEKVHKIKVDKRKIKSEALSELGTFKLEIELHKEVTATCKVIIKEQE
jgi:large subunit ribosomal protein L9